MAAQVKAIHEDNKAIMDEVEDLKVANGMLMDQVEMLTMAAEAAAEAALIEDYFFVNDDQPMLIPADMDAMAAAFCIEGPSVFEFELSATFDGGEANSDIKLIEVVLMINDMVEA